MKPGCAACLVLLLFSAGGATAFEFVTPLAMSEWTARGDPYLCELSHEVAGYGRAVFRHRAGEARGFDLGSRDLHFDSGRIEVLETAPPWRPERRSAALAERRLDGPGLSLAGDLVDRMLRVLLDGMEVTLRGPWREQAGVDLRVVLASTRFREAYDEFLVCESTLLPVNFDQVERTRIQYKPGARGLSDVARRQLDDIAVFLETDQSVLHVFIDGHTDLVGVKHENIAVSEERAQTVRRYLERRGVDPSMIVTRWHGEKYPVAKGSSAAANARNRRTTVRLSTEPWTPPPEPEVAAPEPAPPTAAVPAAGDGSPVIDAEDLEALVTP